MKRPAYFLILSCAIIVIIGIVINPLISFFLKRELGSIFLKSHVSVAKIQINFPRLVINGINIRRQPLYNFRINKLTLDFNPALLLQGRLKEVNLADVEVSFDLGASKVIEFRRLLKLNSPGIFSINSLELANLSLDGKARDLLLKARLDARINLVEEEIQFSDLKVDSASSAGIGLKNAVLKIKQGSEGEFSMQEISYDKFKLTGLTAKARLSSKDLSFGNFSAALLSGRLEGELRLKLSPIPSYWAGLKFFDCDLQSLIQDFDLGARLQLSGLLGGEMTLAGEGLSARIIDGYFSASAAGGSLTIKDDRLLKNIAQRSAQSFDILVESFKNYHYNTGVIRLLLKENDLILETNMDGEAGKRDFTVVIHKFSNEDETYTTK